MARKNEGGKSIIPWHATDEGVQAKGLELTPPLKPQPSETHIMFKARVLAAVDNGGTSPIPPRSTVTTFPQEPPRSKPVGIAPLKSLVKVRAEA